MLSVNRNMLTHAASGHLAEFCGSADGQDYEEEEGEGGDEDDEDVRSVSPLPQYCY